MDIKEFRLAVDRGKKQISKNQKASKKEKAVFYVPSGSGRKTLEIDVYIKQMTGMDYQNFHSIQISYEGVKDNEPGKEVCSRYAAAVIVGCTDVNGERIFTEEDVEFLECPMNLQETIRLCSIVLKRAETDLDAQTAKKPE